jgi:hypothetical protein
VGILLYEEYKHFTFLSLESVCGRCYLFSNVERVILALLPKFTFCLKFIAILELNSKTSFILF